MVTPPWWVLRLLVFHDRLRRCYLAGSVLEVDCPLDLARSCDLDDMSDKCGL
jgi:hypothetical protein